MNQTQREIQAIKEERAGIVSDYVKATLDQKSIALSEKGYDIVVHTFLSKSLETLSVTITHINIKRVTTEKHSIKRVISDQGKKSQMDRIVNKTMDKIESQIRKQLKVNSSLIG